MSRAVFRDTMPCLEEIHDLDDDDVDEIAAEMFNLSAREQRSAAQTRAPRRGRDEDDDDDDDDDDDAGAADDEEDDEDDEDDDEPEDDRNDDDDEDDDASDEVVGQRDAAKRRREDALDQLALAALEQRAAERALGFSQPVRVRKIDYSPFDPHGWVFDDHAAQTVYNVDRSADEHILSMTARESSAVAPPSGTARVYELPTAIDAIVFERWMLHTPVVTPTNSVATFYVGFLPDLADLVQRCAAFSFNPKRFAACVARFRGGTVLTFTSGSAVCTGPSGPALSNAKCQEFVLLLNQLRVPATMQNYRLQNVVSSAAVGFPLHLDRIAARYPMNADYKPNRFPGCIFRVGIGQVVAIFYKSGKCILTGLKTRTETRIVWMLLHSRVLREFRADAARTHVSERLYRQHVVDDASVIEATCSTIDRVLRRRASFDAAGVKREGAEAAHAERAEMLADAVRRELLDGDADHSSAIDALLGSSRFVDLTRDDDVTDVGAHCAQPLATGDVKPRNLGPAPEELARMFAV